MTTPIQDDDAVFGDMGLSDAPDDPNSTPDGMYKAVVHEIKMFKHNGREAGKDRFCIITYRIIDPEYPALKDNTIDEWKSANKGDSSKQKAFLKSRFLGLGVSKEDVDAGRINFRSLVGLPVNITVKNKDGFTNVNKVVRTDGDAKWEGSTTSQSTNQATAKELDF